MYTKNKPRDKTLNERKGSSNLHQGYKKINAINIRSTAQPIQKVGMSILKQRKRNLSKDVTSKLLVTFA